MKKLILLLPLILIFSACSKGGDNPINPAFDQENETDAKNEVIPIESSDVL